MTADSNINRYVSTPIKPHYPDGSPATDVKGVVSPTVAKEMKEGLTVKIDLDRQASEYGFAIPTSSSKADYPSGSDIYLVMDSTTRASDQAFGFEASSMGWRNSYTAGPIKVNEDDPELTGIITGFKGPTHIDLYC